jgi:hypothetical protein
VQPASGEVQNGLTPCLSFQAMAVVFWFGQPLVASRQLPFLTSLGAQFPHPPWQSGQGEVPKSGMGTRSSRQRQTDLRSSRSPPKITPITLELNHAIIRHPARLYDDL